MNALDLIVQYLRGRGLSVRYEKWGNGLYHLKVASIWTETIVEMDFDDTVVRIDRREFCLPSESRIVLVDLAEPDSLDKIVELVI